VTTLVEIHPQAIARERAREATSAIGMMVALGAWGMMFAALLFVYLGLRSQARTWPPPGLELPVVLPAANTVVMLASSAMLVVALKRLRAGVRGPAVAWTALTFALGLLFVALQVVLWRGLWESGITFTTGAVGTVVYALTSLHALHVAMGLAVLGYLLVVATRGEQLQRKVATLRLCGMFWHFVDAVWLVMFLSMFVL
jgi:heme/copper-type cytochrome/quinol oxidase subunit 3